MNLSSTTKRYACLAKSVSLKVLRSRKPMPLDMSVWTDGLNTSRVYSRSGKIQVGCILGLGKIQVGCISILRISDQPNGFRAFFSGLFILSK